MKYILFEDFSGQAIPLLFPDRIRHDEMREVVPYSTVLAAGYVTLTPRGLNCHGESKALGKAARDEDAQLIAAHFAE